MQDDFRRAFEAARANYSAKDWPSLPPAEQTAAIYRELRLMLRWQQVPRCQNQQWEQHPGRRRACLSRCAEHAVRYHDYALNLPAPHRTGSCGLPLTAYSQLPSDAFSIPGSH